jgi:chromosome segregation ATPase
MLWVLVGLILGSLAYTAIIASDYKSRLEDLQPRIQRLEEQGVRLKEMADREQQNVQATKSQIEETKVVLADAKKEVTRVNAELATSQNAEEQLEMAAYKADFRKNR